MKNNVNVTMNFNHGEPQPFRINNSLEQSIIVTVDPKTNEFIITTEGNPSILFKDKFKINTFNV